MRTRVLSALLLPMSRRSKSRPSSHFDFRSDRHLRIEPAHRQLFPTCGMLLKRRCKTFDDQSPLRVPLRSALQRQPSFATSRGDGFTLHRNSAGVAPRPCRRHGLLRHRLLASPGGAPVRAHFARPQPPTRGRPMGHQAIICEHAFCRTEAPIFDVGVQSHRWRARCSSPSSRWAADATW